MLHCTVRSKIKTTLREKNKSSGCGETRQDKRISSQFSSFSRQESSASFIFRLPDAGLWHQFAKNGWPWHLRKSRTIWRRISRQVLSTIRKSSIIEDEEIRIQDHNCQENVKSGLLDSSGIRSTLQKKVFNWFSQYTNQGLALHVFCGQKSTLVN